MGGGVVKFPRINVNFYECARAIAELPDCH